MTRPDWRYGDVLEHPLLHGLRIMFIAWDEVQEYTLAGVVLSGEPRMTMGFQTGEVRSRWEWAKAPAMANLIEKGPR